MTCMPVMSPLSHLIPVLPRENDDRVFRLQMGHPLAGHLMQWREVMLEARIVSRDCIALLPLCSAKSVRQGM